MCVFEIVGEKGKIPTSEMEKISSFEKALAFYKKGDWEKALSLFQEIENDMLAQVYTARCQRFIESGPPEGWAGVYQLKEK